MIFCQKSADQLGVDDFGAIMAIVAGLNILSTTGQFAGATPGTSCASRGARKIFGNAKFPWGRELPSKVGGDPPHKFRVIMTQKESNFIGRGIPAVGWVILAK
ncbi:hypothetical protein IRM71_16480 [Erwinia amylovora]|uniref:Uncharacterized protein n=3 Tax=Erwinia amylovora TaxID=552 RepID=A0A831EQU4_ERWAM|nr:hypothetical protein [Erwinia amylovora]EKV55126.1 hypothetical protein EaACW_0275 [Erwinia amylovora ACW56400]CBA19211.1 hypothetical protein EAMY_0269 [Erwinia amylovora CFBP1430]CCO77120.1 hypothetical protein BN432_0284 [Erwinia amylovora Ea356]CCO80902.1 hypothetical protein BN433_0292 [Erwinia amylovora Ea266]CCO84707.1 hypothetical protein BN434_0282 [Erwinia amylovora CFBP 2585]